MGPVKGEGVAVEGGVKGIGRDRGKLGDEIGRVGFSLCLCLSCSSWAGKGEGKQRGRMGGNPSCGRDAFPQLVEVTKGCGEREWRELVD